MTDKGKLKDWFDSGDLVLPSYDEASFVDLALALADLAGSTKVSPTRESRRLAELIGPAEHLVFVLVDGLGDRLLSRAPSTGFLRSHRVERLRAVFPSTTASALSSLATAAWPGVHASCGWWMYLRSRGISITTLPFVERFEETPLRDHGISAEDVLMRPSVWGTLRRETLTLLKAGIEDGEFARYLAGGGAREGYQGVEDALARASTRVSTAKGPTFTYVYLPQLDARCHDEGIDRALGVLEGLDRHLGWFAEDVAGKARLVISADHGMVDLPPDRVFTIEEGHELLDTLEVPPTGEPTMPIFHVRAGRRDRFEALFRDLVGDAFALIPVEEVERLRLFGPGDLADASRERLGTFMAVANPPAALYLQRRGKEQFIHRAVHSGLSPSEMWIPLILAE